MKPKKNRHLKNANQAAPESGLPSVSEADGLSKSQWLAFIGILILAAGAVGLVLQFSRRQKEALRVQAEGAANTLTPPFTAPASVSETNHPAARTNLIGAKASGGQAAWLAMSDSDKAVALLMEGNDLLKEGKMEAAIKAFRESLTFDKGSEDTHYNLGIALAKAGKLDEAIKHYEETLRILPDYAEAHNNLGNLLAKQGKLSEATEHFNEAIRANPEHHSAHNNLGSLLARQAKISAAITNFSRAVELMPDYLEARINLGNAYLVQERLDDAAKQFEEVLRLRPDFEPAKRSLESIAEQKAQRK